MNPPIFVGRREEMDALTKRVRLAATRRSPMVAVIEGEAGIGKTTLVEHAIAPLGRRGWTIRRGSGDDLARSRPFWPMEQALGRRVRQRLVRPSDGGPFDDEAPRIADAIADVVAGEAAESPLVFVLDDLQWADTYTVRAIPRDPSPTGRPAGGARPGNAHSAGRA